MRDINLLVPKAQELYYKFEAAMQAEKLPFIVTSTLRTAAEQNALYAQGRENLEVINALRKIAGMQAIGPVEAAKKVTWTMASRHLTGRAFDIALLNKGKPHWDLKISVDEDDIPDYFEAAKIGQKVGLIAGGLWDKADWPHFEVQA